MEIGNKTNNSFIANCPNDFDFNKAISKATKIYITTAFAHMTGWNLIKEPLKKSGADVLIVSGLDFCHTEPAVLKEWRNKKNSHIFLLNCT